MTWNWISCFKLFSSSRKEVPNPTQPNGCVVHFLGNQIRIFQKQLVSSYPFVVLSSKVKNNKTGQRKTKSIHYAQKFQPLGWFIKLIQICFFAQILRDKTEHTRYTIPKTRKRDIGLHTKNKILVNKTKHYHLKLYSRFKLF